MMYTRSLLTIAAWASLAAQGPAADLMPIWPDLAPGESKRDTGTAQPRRPNENPPITRLVNIRQPRLDVHLAKNPNGVGILILPGGGFIKVVPDMEGDEAAPFLNDIGISVFVLHYRTSEGKPKEELSWKRPLQDAQRALRLIRAKSKEWRVDPDKLGVLGFSAGGQVASILHTAGEKAVYDSVDNVDSESCAPNFSLLIYPWRVQDSRGELLPQIKITKESPPAFIVHTHDDNSSSLGSVLIYMGLKQNNVPAELHVYENGGHGYGMRQRPNSNIGSWPDRARDWLVRRGLGTAPPATPSNR